MKRKGLITTMILASLSLSACGGGTTQSTAEPTTETAVTEQTTAAAQEAAPSDEGIITASDKLPFTLGDPVSGHFTGNVYLKPMIANDETYNFPQTNDVTFEPGARSYWHSHGGMVIIGTGGVG